MAKLNVLYLSHLNDLSRGGQRSLLTLVEHLDGSQVQPFLLVNADGELAEAFRRLGARVFCAPFPSVNPKRLMAIVRTLRNVRRILHEQSINIVHSDHERASWYACMAARKTAAAVIWHVRVARSHHLDKYLVKRADALIGVSEAVFDRFSMACDQSKFRKVFNGVDLNVFRPAENVEAIRHKLGLPSDRKIVAFVGQIHPHKGVMELLRAWQLLTDSSSEFVPPMLLFIGSRQGGDDWEPEFDELMAQPRLRPHVKVLPQQPNIHEWMAAVDAVILPSHKEGMGRVMFEAMACGALAMGTDVPGIREAVTPETGILFKPQSPQSIAGAVVKIFSSPRKFSELRAAGLERARTVFDVRVHAQNIQAVYDEFQEKKRDA